MKKALKNIIKIILKPYFAVRSNYSFWLLLNSQSRKFFNNEDNISLDKTQSGLLSDLKKNGVAIASLNDLFPGELEKLEEYSQKLLPQAKTKDGKPFLKGLWGNVVELGDNNPFTKIILSDKTLDIVSAYLGMWPKAYYSSLDLTIPVGDKDGVRSQLWHRDPEDLKQVKVFIYLTNVDETSGPFMYLLGSHKGGLLENLAPIKPPKGSYPDSGLVEAHKDRIKVMTGSKGSIIFCDTAGLHKGGHAKLNERLMFTTEYSSKASLRPNIKYTVLINPESKKGKYALDKNLGFLKYFNIPVELSIRYGIFE